MSSDKKNTSYRWKGSYWDSCCAVCEPAESCGYHIDSWRPAGPIGVFSCPFLIICSRHLYCIYIDQRMSCDNTKYSFVTLRIESVAFNVSLVCYLIVSMHFTNQIPRTNHSQHVRELKLSFPTRFESTRACLSQFKIRHARLVSRAEVLKVLIHVDPERGFFFVCFFTQAACWFVRSLIRHRKSSFSKYAGKSSYSR